MHRELMYDAELLKFVLLQIAKRTQGKQQLSAFKKEWYIGLSLTV